MGILYSERGIAMEGVDVLFLGFGASFLNKMDSCRYDVVPKKSFYDIIAVSEKGNFEPCHVSGGVLFCPQNSFLAEGIRCPVCVTCGMSRMCTLSFSSVRYDSAMLSLSRRIDGRGFSLLQGDCNVKYDSGLTLYENLVSSGLEMIKNCVL